MDGGLCMILFGAAMEQELNHFQSWEIPYILKKEKPRAFTVRINSICKVKHCNHRLPSIKAPDSHYARPPPASTASPASRLQLAQNILSYLQKYQAFILCINRKLS
uniref:Uncharacterized protein n=1 Tax=Salix viminalis TaxID=40686 RepID=A0A6N2LLE7_SALVM